MERFTEEEITRYKKYQRLANTILYAGIVVGLLLFTYICYLGLTNQL